MITLENVSFGYRGHLILRDISLTVDAHRINAVMGPSGCGKTTLLKLMCGLLMPDSGRVLIDGQDVRRCSRRGLYALRQRMGMLFQSGSLLNDMTVFDNVALPLREHTPLSEALIRTVVLLKLQAVGLRGARDLYPNELSGGMRRRAALARAVALDPALVFFDEPFAGQDPINMSVLVKLIRTLTDAMALTSIVVSHDVDETFGIADKVFLLFDGEIIAADSPQALLQSDSRAVRQFVRGEVDGPIAFHQRACPFSEDILS